MKKLICVILVIILMPIVAIADIDLSSLSYNELVSLINKAQLEIMKSDKWQEVEVPPGTYIVGKDIPAGHWTIAINDSGYADFEIGTTIKSNGEIDYMSCLDDYKHITLIGKSSFLYTEGNTTSYSLELLNNWYVVITTGSIIFTPYKGNNFTFK